ncbi:hypothetical protein MLD38_002410 [Melastoma candidum]|uniref:Uncharacterized protein n=1 Tax=Melastoma candidum TaxID=119954 RepID=A0ACB9S0J1_9MYRT|nr:hypothetical protein MLD38_002410 [Melastoma candidum]
MKLLGWMHRKSRHNGGNKISDFVPAQEVHGRLSYGEPPLKQSEIYHLLRKSFAGIDAVKIEFRGDQGPLTAEFDGLFHGFLAIGTLGSEPSAAAEEEAPTFEISVADEMPMLEFLVADETPAPAPALELSVEEVLAEKETAITENELNLINEELGKALMAVPDEGGSSGRNSYVSAGRGSYASGGATTICPLQGYLLGSAAGLPGVKDGDSITKEEQRTTLEELFRITDEEIKEEVVKKGDGGDGADVPFVGKFAKKKKMMSKLVRAVSTSRGSIGRGTPAATAASETKLQKIMHMFQKKVDPEAGMSSEKSPGKHRKVAFAAEVKQKMGGRRDVCGSGIPIEAMIKPEDMEKLLLKEKLRRTKCMGSKVPQTATDGNESKGSRECWIKTDEDYVVLEL